jgi:NADPH:quinone reductase-like Zn-dependent oxidoreductase
LYSRRHKFFFGTQQVESLQTIAEFAASGKLKITIGRTAKLDDAIVLITDLETGRRTHGKAIIVMT